MGFPFGGVVLQVKLTEFRPFVKQKIQQDVFGREGKHYILGQAACPSLSYKGRFFKRFSLRKRQAGQKKRPCGASQGRFGVGF